MGSFGINNFPPYPLQTTSIVSYLRCVAGGWCWSVVGGGGWCVMCGGWWRRVMIGRGGGW